MFHEPVSQIGAAVFSAPTLPYIFQQHQNFFLHFRFREIQKKFFLVFSFRVHRPPTFIRNIEFFREQNVVYILNLNVDHFIELYPEEILFVILVHADHFW